jgi:thioredoxin:protein disulfide reductase
MYHTFCALRRNVFLILSMLCLNIMGQNITITPVDATTYDVCLKLDLAPQDFIDKDSIILSIDHPDIKITQWHGTPEQTKLYDPTYQETRTVYEHACTLHITMHTYQPIQINDASFHVSYYQGSKKGMVQQIVRLASAPSSFEATSVNTTGVVDQEPKFSNPLPSKPLEKPADMCWSAYLSHLVEKTDSIGIRILLVVLLGLLMSLTPCIYPMIPITVGILQTQGSGSFMRNALLSCAYTFGIATTFALLGLTAATTGNLFGSLMANPIFIVTIVGILAYLGLSMLGFYDMYTPSFMRTSHANNSGSIFSAFIFGAISGTVASPCLSPGLILLLSIVATMGNKFLGFILLFAFGVGLSLPLLLIGTFSTSLLLLPRAGTWMVEVKKFFGLLLFGMCFYFLHAIIAWPLLLALIAFSLISAGVFYLYTRTPQDSSTWHSIKTLLGVSFIALSVFIAIQALQAFIRPSCPTPQEFWVYDIDQARTQARTQHRPLFIDIGASYCSICKAIDRTVLSHPRVIEKLQHFVAVKINAAEKPEVVQELQHHYTIKGVPTLLLLDASTGAVLKQWGSELYDMAIEEFLQQLDIRSP